MKNQRLYLGGLLIFSILIAFYIFYSGHLTGFTVSVFWFSLTMVPLSILLLFLEIQILKAWLVFTSIWIPLSVLVLANVSEYGGGSFVPGPGRKEVALFMASLFLLISLILIAWKWYKLRKDQPQTKI